MSSHGRGNAKRQRLAYEAARIMAEQGVHEFDRARRKAAERAGIGNKRHWPNNGEIQEELLQYRRLFQNQDRALELSQLRRQAIDAMRTFSAFLPRLVGPVLTGTGDGTQGVRLQLFADNPEDVVLRLLEQGIPWRERDIRLRYGGGVHQTHPAFTFVAGETPFELVVLPAGARRNPPLDPVSERPEKGADIRAVQRLLAAALPPDSY
jgi:hypothetical protein